VTKIFALFNQCGGVCKSTLTFNLGYHLSLLKQRVLLIDVDPQASLTTFMGLEPSQLERTLYNAIIEDESLPLHTIWQLDLVPANIDLSGAELELVTADMRDLRLKEAIAPIAEQYDSILIDCPPSLGILSYISLVAATHILVPIQTHYKALRGTELLLQTFARVRKKANKSLEIAGFIPTLFDSRTSQDNLSLQTIKEQLSPHAKVFPAIPRSIAFADSVQNHLPLYLYQPKHPAIPLLNNIAQTLTEI
jgi:chromosome partitioning protein